MGIVSKAREQLARKAATEGWKTATIRSVSASMFRELDNKQIDHVFGLCERLLDEEDWALHVMAYDWAYRVRKQYDERTFERFDRWLKTYVRDWGDCDDFCTHALGELLSRNNDLFPHVKEWTKHPHFAVRRAAAVVLIYPIKKNKYIDIDPFAISDALMHDDHHLVLKGYGWMLKVLSEREPAKVIAYLQRHKRTMPRTAFRYALEKMDPETRRVLMEKD